MTRPPRNRALSVAVDHWQLVAIRKLAASHNPPLSISEYVRLKMMRSNAWNEVDKLAIRIQTGTASRSESGNDG